MIVIGCDPGYEQSAVLVYNGAHVLDLRIEENERLLGWLCETSPEGQRLVIEQVESMGKPVGREVFETVFFSGRLAEAWARCGGRHERLTRRAVKLHLCQSLRVTDAHVRQALIDRFGPTKAQAVGNKRAPGPLYGVRSHGWAALALAVTWHDQHCLAPARATAVYGDF